MLLVLFILSRNYIYKDMKIDKEKALNNLEKAIFAGLSECEIDLFNSYAVMVNYGTKLAAHVTCKDKPKIKSTKYIQLAEKNKLKILFTDFPSLDSQKNGWKNVYIFKDEKLRDIIIDAEKLDKNSDLYHFVQGKLFSYSDKEIFKFLDNNNKLKQEKNDS